MVQTGSMHSFIATNWFKIKRKKIFHRKHACAQFPVPLTFVPLSSEKVALGLLPSLLASFPSSDLFLFLLNALNSLKIKVYIYLYSYTHILHSISSGYDSSMLHKLPSLDFSSSIILFATVQGAAVRGRKPRTVLLIHRLIQVRRRVTSTCCLPPPSHPLRPATAKQTSPQIAWWAFECRNQGSSWCWKVKPISGKDIRLETLVTTPETSKLRWVTMVEVSRDKTDMPEYCRCYACFK